MAGDNVSDKAQKQGTEEATTSSDQRRADEAARAETDTSQEEIPSGEQSPKFKVSQKSDSGPIIAPQGETVHFTVNLTHNHFHEYARTIHSIEKQSVLLDTEELSEDNQDPLANLIYDRQRVPTFDDRTPTFEGEIPQDEDKLSDWYYNKLDEYEQCYVQVVAILHGSKIQEIYQGTDAFYRIVQQQRYNTFPEWSEQGTQPEEKQKNVPGFIFPRQSSLRLQKKTYTVARRVNGAECLFWQDVDRYGLSDFGSRVLTFISKELCSKGEHWPSFAEEIQRWSSWKKRYAHRATRAAHALGTILWVQDAADLSNQARQWARTTALYWQRLTASLLDGAREIEIVELGEQADNERHSAVLRLLSEWKEKVHEEQNATTIRLGCTIANTYGLLGRRPHDISLALQGLDDLLTFPDDQEIDITNVYPLFEAAVLPYVSLTWAGHLRAVLQSLATIVQRLVLYRVLPPQLKKRERDRMLHASYLETTLNAFFLVAATTTPDKEIPHTSLDTYMYSLGETVVIPDIDGRSALLVAILTADSMKESLITLLCAAIVSRHGGPAFELMRSWIDTVVTSSNTSENPSKTYYNLMLQFMVDLGQTIDRWCNDLAARHYRKPSGGAVYRHKLALWQQEGERRKHPIATFACEVRWQLSR